MKLLENKVAVITGGCGSVGLATAELFLAHGARLMLVDLDQGRLDEAAGRFGGDRVVTHAGDVAEAGTVRAYLAAVAARWGKFDVLFSNAGNPGHIARLEDTPEEAFDLTYRIHARGAFLACKLAPASMRDGGSIIVTSSLAGVRGGGGTNISYVAAKHAQIGVVRAAARALAPRAIRVNAINPGPVENSFQTGIEERMSQVSGVNVGEELDKAIPLRRHARPAEVASVALFLASDMSSYVTGAVQMIDGGIMS